jgi:phosphate starvation-inducible protein PhoH
VLQLPPLKTAAYNAPKETSNPMRHTLIILLASVALCGGALAQGFKFSNEDAADKAREAEQQAKVQALLASPCRAKIKNQKIMVLIGESRDGYLQTAQSSYSGHFDALNARLQSLGLKTYTQAQITAQIAQAEIDAYFKNNPDAALSASKRLSAQYILRGLISSQAGYNTIVRVNQVTIRMAFTLTDANGRILSQTSADNASYAGVDTSGMALNLINEKADEVVAQLYSDYCRLGGS